MTTVNSVRAPDFSQIACNPAAPIVSAHRTAVDVPEPDAGLRRIAILVFLEDDVPKVEVRLYKDDEGRSPVLEWLRVLRFRNANAWAKLRSRLGRLEQLGYELRRPQADSIGAGLYELRARSGHVNYRILYFFHGREVVILAHALTKEDRLPLSDVRRALDRKLIFESNPENHWIAMEPDDGEDL